MRETCLTCSPSSPKTTSKAVIVQGEGRVLDTGLLEASVTILLRLLGILKLGGDSLKFYIPFPLAEKEPPHIPTFG